MSNTFLTKTTTTTSFRKDKSTPDTSTTATAFLHRDRRAEDLAISHGFIEAEHEGESTLDVTQQDILENLDLDDSAKKWRRLLNTARGPYKIDYSEDGAHLLAYGSAGEARLYNCHQTDGGGGGASGGGSSGGGGGGGHHQGGGGHPRGRDHLAGELCSVNSYERILNGAICYNENCFALACKSSVNLYDKGGVRIHDFDSSEQTTGLDYLPYHFLLVTGSACRSLIEWRDLSTGKFMGKLKLRNFSTTSEALRKNSFNGCVYTGHNDGLVKIWSPNLSEEAMAFHARIGAVQSVLPFHRTYVAVSGSKSLLRIFDIRKPDQSVNHYRLKSLGPVSLDISQSGLLAIAQGPQLNIWKNPTAQSSDPIPTSDRFYLSHRYQGSGLRFENVRFRPFEDVIGAGLNQGIETFIIPGSGSSAIDTLENNPYATNRERAKALVRRLLDKLPADTINLDPTQLLQLGSINNKSSKMNAPKKSRENSSPKRSRISPE